MHNEDVLNPNYFLNWLRLQPSDRMLSENGGGLRCMLCPLATFLVEALPFEWAKVGVWTYEVSHNIFDMEGTKLKLPDWAYNFVRDFDMHASDDTAGSAVVIMERLLKKGV